LQEREVCAFTNSFSESAAAVLPQKTLCRIFFPFSQNRFLLVKTDKINGERMAVGHNDIYTIVLSDTMHHVSAIRGSYQAGILKHFKKWF
jgi:hypothetical protein